MSLLDRVHRLIATLTGPVEPHADECDGADCALHHCGQANQ